MSGNSTSIPLGPVNAVPSLGSVNSIALGGSMSMTRGDEITSQGAIDLKTQGLVTPGRYVAPTLSVNSYGVITSISAGGGTETPAAVYTEVGDVAITAVSQTQPTNSWEVAIFDNGHEGSYYNDGAMNEVTGVWTAPILSAPWNWYSFSADVTFLNGEYDYADQVNTQNPATRVVRIRRTDPIGDFNIAAAAGPATGQLASTYPHVVSCSQTALIPAGATVEIQVASYDPDNATFDFEPSVSITWLRPGPEPDEISPA